jgi:hypothetical protein
LETEDRLFAPEGGLGYELYRSRWPDKLVMITEFSNPAPSVDWAVKASQYLRYYQHLCNVPGIGGAFAFVASAGSNTFPNETWRFDDGRHTAIPAVIGERSF